MRNDHLMIVTDAGVTLHLGWDYNAPYTLDPLTGVDVDLQTAQSLGQLGTTVERQSVGGVSALSPAAFGALAGTTLPSCCCAACPTLPPAPSTLATRLLPGSWSQRPPIWPR